MINVAQCGCYEDGCCTITNNGTFCVITSESWTRDTKTRCAFTITYIVINNGGNTSSATSVINVIYTEAPIISLIGSAIDAIDKWSDSQI